MNPNPYLGRNNHPRVYLEVYLGSWIKADCLIDTGFSSGISLPEKLLKGKKIKPIAYQQFELADGSVVPFPIYTHLMLVCNSKGCQSSLRWVYPEQIHLRTVYKVKTRYKETEKDILLISTIATAKQDVIPDLIGDLVN